MAADENRKFRIFLEFHLRCRGFVRKITLAKEVEPRLGEFVKRQTIRITQS